MFTRLINQEPETCADQGWNCCDCGEDGGCGCAYCWSCHACDNCRQGVEPCLNFNEESNHATSSN